MNTVNNPLITATSLTRTRTLFRVANMAERSLLSRIFHELAEFLEVAYILHYEDKDYQDALKDYLAALNDRYYALVNDDRELTSSAETPARTETNKETEHDEH